MNLTYGNNMGVVFLIEILKVGKMLEVVRINLSLICCQIRLHIVIVGHDFNINALFL